MNFFTLGFSHDWCVSDGYVRISGEDHYCGLKAPRYEERCGRLADWGFTKYPYLNRDKPVQFKYGVYSETPDHMPLVGSMHDDENIYYMVGCNACGQASFAAAASITPSLLGYAPWTDLGKRIHGLFNIRRYTGKQLSRL